MSILRSESLTRTYVSGGREITVLRDITFDLEPGGFLAITGPSGSGKSTLLGLLAGLDRPTRGRVVLDGHDLSAMTEDERARVRAAKVGFVFQSFHLDPDADRARERAGPPRAARGGRPRAGATSCSCASASATAATTTPPSSRAASSSASPSRARSRTGRRILFADEPTGNLDAANGANVVALLGELNRELGTTLVLVTHDPELAARAGRVIRLRDGAVVEDAALVEAGR